MVAVLTAIMTLLQVTAMVTLLAGHKLHGYSSI